MSRGILILRPEPGASRTAARAAALGLVPIALPLFEIVAKPWTPPPVAHFDAVLMTSAAAARHAGQELTRFTGLPLYTVGARTAEAARDAGFDDIRAGTQDAQAMIARMTADGICAAFHPAGADRTVVDMGTMAVVSVTVYAAAAIDPPPVVDMHSGVALLHSARAARRFAEIAGDRSRFSVAAISAAVLEAAGTGWRAGSAADRPSDDALLAAAARLCQ